MKVLRILVVAVLALAIPVVGLTAPAAASEQLPRGQVGKEYIRLACPYNVKITAGYPVLGDVLKGKAELSEGRAMAAALAKVHRRQQDKMAALAAVAGPTLGPLIAAVATYSGSWTPFLKALAGAHSEIVFAKKYELMTQWGRVAVAPGPAAREALGLPPGWCPSA